jgi:hypothetical protein
MVGNPEQNDRKAVQDRFPDRGYVDELGVNVVLCYKKTWQTQLQGKVNLAMREGCKEARPGVQLNQPERAIQLQQMIEETSSSTRLSTSAARRDWTDTPIEPSASPSTH